MTNENVFETLKALAVGDAVRVRCGTDANFRSFTVNFVGEHLVGLVGPKGGEKTLVPSLSGRTVSLTDVHTARSVSGLEREGN